MSFHKMKRWSLFFGSSNISVLVEMSVRWENANAWVFVIGYVSIGVRAQKMLESGLEQIAGLITDFSKNCPTCHEFCLIWRGFVSPSYAYVCISWPDFRKRWKVSSNIMQSYNLAGTLKPGGGQAPPTFTAVCLLNWGNWLIAYGFIFEIIFRYSIEDLIPALDIIFCRPCLVSILHFTLANWLISPFSKSRNDFHIFSIFRDQTFQFYSFRDAFSRCNDGFLSFKPEYLSEFDEEMINY